MLTAEKHTGHGYSVTRCDFADLAELMTGKHTSPANAAVMAHVQGRLMGTAWVGGLASLDAARALLVDGWSEGAAKAAQLTPSLTNIVPSPKPIRRRVRWADAGTELSIDRALAGQWDVAWRATGPHPMQPRVLSLACNFGGYAGVTHKQLFWCAAQMIVVCDVLEHAGYGVELRAVKCNQTPAYKHVLLDVLVKRQGQPLRADTIASVFGHAGVYRTYGHALITTSPYTVGLELGVPQDIGPTLRLAASDSMTDPADYIFEYAYSMRDAAQNITHALTTILGENA